MKSAASRGRERAPFAAWSTLVQPWSRDAVLAALSAGRQALSARVTDTVLLAVSEGQLQLDTRAVTWRGEDDLTDAMLLLRSTFEHHGLHLPVFAADDRRVRLGAAPATWPKSREPVASLDLRVAWPDAPALLDTIAALVPHDAARRAQHLLARTLRRCRRLHPQ